MSMCQMGRLNGAKFQDKSLLSPRILYLASCPVLLLSFLSILMVFVTLCTNIIPHMQHTHD